MSFVFIFLAVVLVVSALAVVVSRRLMHSTLALICHLIAMAGLFALLDAEFIAVVQLLLYASAIIILILFAMLLLRSKIEAFCENEHLFVASVAVVGILVLFFILPVSASFVSEVSLFEQHHLGTVLSIGNSLFSRYVIPFQMIGVLIIVALVAVVMLGQVVKSPDSDGDGRDDC